MKITNNEVWKDIPSYEGFYQASTLGRIKSLPRLVNNRFKDVQREERILKPSKSKNGYLRVVLMKEGKRKYISVHRLIALTFLSNELNLKQVNHINKNKEDNRVENLEWCTSKYNTRYSVAKKIEQYDLDGKYIKTWNCIRDVENELGIKNNNLNHCLKNKNKTAGGYIWRYANENN